MIEYKKPIIQKIGLILLKRNGNVHSNELAALKKCNVKMLKSILKDLE